MLAGKQWMRENPRASTRTSRFMVESWRDDHVDEHLRPPQDYRWSTRGAGSDLVARMGYKSQSYRELFSAPYHIGKSAEENVNEYRRRSPVCGTRRKRQTP